MLRPTQVIFVLVSALTLEFATRSPSTPRGLLDAGAEPGTAANEAH